MTGSCGSVRIAQAAKYAQETVVRGYAKEQLVGGAGCTGVAGAVIDQIGSCVQGFSPKPRRHGRMEQKSTHTVIQGAKNALCLAILLASIRAREAKDGAMGREERAH